MSAPTDSAAPLGRWLVPGRAFVHPAFDLLVIGGGLSLLATTVLVARPGLASRLDPQLLAAVLLACNMAHFAASTVRLYTVPGGFERWPFVTMGLPLVSAALLTLCIWQAEWLGVAAQKLYLSWSPYHFAAQAYGLAVMYAHRSGCRLAASDRRWLRWTSLMPFFYAIVTGPGIGLQWVLPDGWVTAAWAVPVSRALFGLALAGPLVLVVRSGIAGRPALPLIAPLLLLANGIWWLLLPPIQAFIWATIFHGLQYLAIAIVYHVKEQGEAPGSRRAPWVHAVRFYLLSLLLGYALFNVLPFAYMSVGFGPVESVVVVIAAINIHHFFVDGFIWRFRRGGSNRRIAEAAGATPA